MFWAWFSNTWFQYVLPYAIQFNLLFSFQTRNLKCFHFINIINKLFVISWAIYSNLGLESCHGIRAWLYYWPLCVVFYLLHSCDFWLRFHFGPFQVCVGSNLESVRLQHAQRSGGIGKCQHGQEWRTSCTQPREHLCPVLLGKKKWCNQILGC